MPKGLVAALTVAALCIVYLASALGPAQAAPAQRVVGQAPQQDYDIPNGHFYTQANGMGGGGAYGYRITDDGGIAFWTEFKRLGGVDVLGYPASTRFTLDGFTVQATQRVILQWRPDVKQAYFVNVFDKLHDTGKDGWLQANKLIPPQLPTSFDAGKTDFNAIAAGRLVLLTKDSALQKAYINGKSPAQAVALYGLPTSDVVDVGPAFVVRAQRVAFQRWKVDMSFAKAGDVTQVLGGDISKDAQAGIVPVSAQITETATGVPSATPTPAATPTPVATATPTPTPKPAFPYQSKDVTTPPLDCGSGNRVPCLSQAPNAGAQYIQGHVLDPSGNRLGGVTVQAYAYGNRYTNTSEGDGLFTINISSTCPLETRVYTVSVSDSNGNPISDTRTVTYNNCNDAGEFHFDFVRVG